MGTNNLATQSDGTTIDATDINQFKSALVEDIVPRNSTGVPTDEGGKCGTGNYRFSETNSTKVNIGATSSALSIEEDANNHVVVKENGSQVAFLGPLSYQISSSSGDFSTTSTSFVDVTNLNITITTHGRPVMIQSISDGSSSFGLFGTASSQDKSVAFSLKLLRDGNEISNTYISSYCVAEDPSFSSGIVQHIDVVNAGTYTYKLQIKKGAAAGSAKAKYIKLLVREL